MVTEFKFPDVGEGVTEGTLIKWLVEEGDEVEEDESLAEVETDKAVVEIPSPEDATVLKLHAEEGDTIKVGNVIVTLGEEGEEPSDSTDAAEESGEADESGEEPEKESTSTSVVGQLDEPEDDAVTVEDETGESTTLQVEEQPSPSTGHVLATPATRKLAREKDIDITQVSGTGPGGRITRDDVLNYVERGGSAPQAEESTGTESSQQDATPQEQTSVGVSGGLGTPNRFAPKKYDFEKYGEVEREEMSSTRKAIAKNMERSKYTAPHVTATDDADVTELWDVRKNEKKVAESRDIHLTFLPFIVKACIAAMREYPRMNSSFDEETGEIVKKNYFNIGIAVATENGLMVPNIKNADDKSILKIAKETNELAQRARDHELKIDEMRGGTFTITNYGSIGGRYGTPILNYPEVAILGTGTIREEPVVRDGDIVVRKMLPLSVTFDHRVVDGAYVAQFMNELIKHLEDPDLLLLDE